MKNKNQKTTPSVRRLLKIHRLARELYCETHFLMEDLTLGTDEDYIFIRKMDLQTYRTLEDLFGLCSSSRYLGVADRLERIIRKQTNLKKRHNERANNNRTR